MLDLSDLRFLIALSTAPSLAAAARGLDVSPPAVSQRLALIEGRLHLRLVERGRGPLRLTAEGDFVVQRSGAILGELERLHEALAAHAGRIEGPLHVIAPFGFGRLHVAPVLSRFAAANPDLRPTLLLNEDPLGAMRTGPWDVMIHIGRLRDLSITQRKLAANRRFLVASPGYIARFGLAREPKDIAHHRVGVVRENADDVTLWLLKGPDAAETSLRVDPVFACNDGEVIRGWAVDGHGVVERSEWSVAEDLKSGCLVRILPEWSLPDADIVALLNPRAVRASRVDKFLELLAAEVLDKG